MSNQSAIKNLFADFENNLVDSLWRLDAAHHKCVATTATINTCSAVISKACLDAAALDPSYVCPASALTFNLDRFARACYLSVVQLATSNGGVVELIDPQGVPDPALKAAFGCVCDECLSSAYPGCQWMRGSLSYAECRKELDCYAGNENLNQWTTLINGELDCWNVYYYVGIAATVLLALLVFYGWFSTRGSAAVNIEQSVTVDSS